MSDAPPALRKRRVSEIDRLMLLQTLVVDLSTGQSRLPTREEVDAFCNEWIVPTDAPRIEVKQPSGNRPDDGQRTAGREANRRMYEAMGWVTDADGNPIRQRDMTPHIAPAPVADAADLARAPAEQEASRRYWAAKGVQCDERGEPIFEKGKAYNV